MKTRNVLTTTLAVILTLTLIITVFAQPGGGYKPGDRVRDFSLKNVDGTTVSLAGLGNVNGVIVVFTCNHCPFAKAYESRIIDLHNKFAAKGFPVVAINPNDVVSVPEDSFENMVIRAKEKKFPFKYVLDDTQEIAKVYGATRTPHVYVLQKRADGGFYVAYIGAIDDNSSDAASVKEHYVEDAVVSLMTGAQPTMATTKAIGCTIKWKKN